MSFNYSNVACLFLTIITTTSSKHTYPSINQRVVGGEKADKGEFPFIVGLLIKYKKDSNANAPTKGKKCTGSILSNRWILTAGHCTVPNEGEFDYQVEYAVGEIELSFKKTKPVETTIAHPDYRKESIELEGGGQSTKLHNDVSLVKTRDKIKFDYDVEPVCLSNSITMKGKCRVFGFGSTENPKDEESETNMNLLHSEIKYRVVNDPAALPYMIIFTTEDHYPSAGDSGGPLICDGKQIGVASSVGATGRSALVSYTSVVHFKSWIQENTHSNVFDSCLSAGNNIKAFQYLYFLIIVLPFTEMISV